MKKLNTKRPTSALPPYISSWLPDPDSPNVPALLQPTTTTTSTNQSLLRQSSRVLYSFTVSRSACYPLFPPAYAPRQETTFANKTHSPSMASEGLKDVEVHFFRRDRFAFRGVAPSPLLLLAAVRGMRGLAGLVLSHLLLTAFALYRDRLSPTTMRLSTTSTPWISSPSSSEVCILSASRQHSRLCCATKS